ncbi:hypothetical protein AMATHDRAFT_4236 [Amanita thiersii Skay4041]|uniref:Uncharacterized protein n=1 Tax=Amanita thiersii Skay4041 TaxID=703135 RepID=A0A2A9NR46_9AGAR|nr:hypothetical protein AMATHDRAFT_4236 [Amanita thiersii Skay4041]
MSLGPKTPTRPVKNPARSTGRGGTPIQPAAPADNVTALRESLPPPYRSPTEFERSPTLVEGQSPAAEAGSSKAHQRASFKISPTSSSFKSVSFVPGRFPTTSTVPTTPDTPCPSVSARKKHYCRTCGTPMKGHKRNQCPSPSSISACKAKHPASSPEAAGRNHDSVASIPPPSTSMRSKTVIKTEPTIKGEHEYLHSLSHRATDTSGEDVSVSISAALSASSASGRRKQPHCRKCGTPMRGHKRPGGVPVCPAPESKKAPPLPPLPACTPLPKSSLSHYLIPKDIDFLPAFRPRCSTSRIDPGEDTVTNNNVTAKNVRVPQQQQQQQRSHVSISSNTRSTPVTPPPRSTRMYQQNMTPMHIQYTAQSDTSRFANPSSSPLQSMTPSPPRYRNSNTSNSRYQQPSRYQLEYYSPPLSPSTASTPPSLSSFTTAPSESAATTNTIAAALSGSNKTTLTDLVSALGEPSLTIYETSDDDRALFIYEKAREMGCHSEVLSLPSCACTAEKESGPPKTREDYMGQVMWARSQGKGRGLDSQCSSMTLIDEESEGLPRGREKMGLMGIEIGIGKGRKGKMKKVVEDEPCSPSCPTATTKKKWVILSESKEVMERCVSLSVLPDCV